MRPWYFWNSPGCECTLPMGFDLRFHSCEPKEKEHFPRVTTNHVICETILHLIPTLKNYTTYFRFGESQRSLGNFSHSFIPQAFHSNHLAVSSSYGNNCLKSRTLQKASVEENLPGASTKISQRKTAEAVKNGRDKPRPWMESRRHE